MTQLFQLFVDVGWLLLRQQSDFELASPTSSGLRPSSTFAIWASLCTW